MSFSRIPYWKKYLGQGNTQVCLTSELADAINPPIDRMLDKNNCDPADKELGALNKLCERVSRMFPEEQGQTPEVLTRRLWVIRHKIRKTSCWYLSGDPFLTALDIGPQDHTITVLPGSLAAAREMIDANCERHEERVSIKDRDARAKTLLSFSQGYIWNEELMDGKTNADIGPATETKPREPEAVAA